MTHWTEATNLLDDREPRAQGFIARYAPGTLAFALSAALGVYIVYLRPTLRMSAPPPQIAQAAAPAVPAVKADPFGALGPVTPAPTLVMPAKPQSNPFGALITKGFGGGETFAIEEAPLPPRPPADLRAPDEDSAPLPPHRPSALARAMEPETSARRAVAPSQAERATPQPAPTAPGLFEKLFGGAHTAAPAEPETRMAYAPPPPVSGVGSALAARGGVASSSGGHGFFGGLGLGANPTARFGDHVAVYDISARMVYLPDGTKIEAHSGLGDARDNPAKVNERMRGPTPPATYALSPREALFHGVAALRLTPIDGNVFGRAGLLAHTYMLGPDGDSNGCISFRDYDAFLRAYRNGQVTKLVVVTRL